MSERYPISNCINSLKQEYIGEVQPNPNTNIDTIFDCPFAKNVISNRPVQGTVSVSSQKVITVSCKEVELCKKHQPQDE